MKSISSQYNIIELKFGLFDYFNEPCLGCFQHTGRADLLIARRFVANILVKFFLFFSDELPGMHHRFLLGRSRTAEYRNVPKYIIDITPKIQALYVSCVCARVCHGNITTKRLYYMFNI